MDGWMGFDTRLSGRGRRCCKPRMREKGEELGDRRRKVGWSVYQIRGRGERERGKKDDRFEPSISVLGKEKKSLSLNLHARK